MTLTHSSPLFSQDANRCSQPELWEISSRHLPCGPCVAAHGLDELEFCVRTDSGWSRTSLESLLEIEPDDGKQNILYVHGNWMSRQGTRDRIRFIANQIQCRSQRPIRILFFSWPSQRERHPIQDILENAGCTDTQSQYVQRLLRVFQPNHPLSILAFSFGGRIVTGSLHLEAGGTIQGLSSQCEGASDRPYRVSLVAPAVDRRWLQSHGRFSLAMSRVDRLVNLYNSKDPVLRRFKYVDRLTRPVAAGFSGFVGISSEGEGDPSVTLPLYSQDRVIQYDCRSSLGTTHDEMSYYLRCPCFSKAIENLFWT